MIDANKNKAMIQVLLDRMVNHRLPRLLDIREKLNEDKKLDNFDMEFLNDVINDAQDNEHFIPDNDNELKIIFMKVLSLYKEITDKALENENNKD